MKAELDRRMDEKDHRALAVWAADCAEHVLPFFEAYSEDDRPREAIEAGRAWARGELAVSAARASAFAAHAAARGVGHAAATAAARAAGHAAATAHVTAHARHAAAYAAAATGTTLVMERDWQYQRLPESLRPVAFPPRGAG